MTKKEMEKLSNYLFIEGLRRKLFEKCDKNGIQRYKIKYMINYFLSLGWNEEDTIIYLIGLFNNDTWVSFMKELSKKG